MELRFGTKARITNSDRLNHIFWLEDDTSISGGYFIIESWDGPDGPGELGAFDNWVLTHEELLDFIQADAWEFQWID